MDKRSKKPDLINWDDIQYKTTKTGKPTKETREAIEAVMRQRLAERAVSATKWEPIDIAGAFGLTVGYYYGMDFMEKILPWKDLLKGAFDIAEEAKDFIKDVIKATEIAMEAFPHATASYINLLSGNLIGFQVETAKTILTIKKEEYKRSEEGKLFELKKARIMAEKFRDIAEQQGNQIQVEFYDKKITEINNKIAELERKEIGDSELEDEIIAWLVDKLPLIKIFTSLGLAVITLNITKEVSWSDIAKIIAEGMPL